MEDSKGGIPEQKKDAIKRESKRLFIGVIAGVVLFFALLAAVFLFRPARVYGNTSGNLANGGFVAESDGWVYYNGSIDYSNNGIYKMRSDGSEKTKLIDGLHAQEINVADGWIYFIGDKGLYKMRTDGIGLSKLTDMTLFKDLYLEEGWLYYCDSSDGFYIVKIRTDGTERTQLTGGALFITVADGWIYYKNTDDDLSLYKIRADGTDKTKLSGRQTYNIIVSGDYVYFLTTGENYHCYLYRIRTDGTGEIKLTDNLYDSFNVYNGWIYYRNIDDHSLHKMRTEGTGDVKLSDGVNAYLYIADDWIYYYNDGFCRIKTDGTEKQRVE
jgi:hypothetical protein